MAGYDDDEEVFDDDDFDALPDDAFVELENNAIQFTQAQTQAAQGKVVAPSSDYGDDLDDVDFDEDIIVDEARSTPAIIAPPPRNNQGHPTQQEQFRQQRYGATSNSNSISQLANRTRPTPPRFNVSNYVRPPAAIPLNDSVVAEQGSQHSAASDVKVESLQKQLEELIKERNTLKNELNAKAGEISIVRSKQEKTSKEFERQLANYKKESEEKLAKQQHALEQARTKEKNAATERDFIRRDLAEESERVRRLNKARDAEKKDVNVTPKKKKSLPHRDGFDDDEIEIISPSRVSPSKFQKRILGSPSKPGKRKRKTVESPAGALEIIQPEGPLAFNSSTLALDEAILAKLDIQDDRFDFIGTMLDHRIDAEHLRTVEELGKYALPSSPKESFQSVILGQIPALGLKKQSKELSIEFCNLLITMWKKCKKELYLEPIHLLIDMLNFALEMHTSKIAPGIVDALVDVAAKTIELVAIQRFRKLPEEYQIDTTACMRLLYIVAQGCMSLPENITRFWKLMRWEFVLVMVSANQREEDYLTMYKMLSTSMAKESWGPIPSGEMMAYESGMIMDHLVKEMVEAPCASGTERIGQDKFYRIRLHLLQLFTSMTRSPAASRALAGHPKAMGLFVNLVSEEMDNLARLISLAMRLLYHLVTKHENIDMQRKLAAVPGGPQKYLLCLSRLNYADDDLLLESGIDPDATPFAAEMLDMYVMLMGGVLELASWTDIMYGVWW
ncbi:related to protein UVS-3 (presumed DNA repair and checkpoint control protein) [Phialocephala subalpina]|uniref:Related to protein UVS-3 (Presumed DNA repair and checkpoint control protein) n=1 Tax=Phialocephala subalpina TaxID=576137 RepID=A0A1L7XJ56_9HELO|nr:related to protein UVS-3 (presumed DNA repair and checkpoint control protein) [Phialocephala subalpina]